MAFEYCLCLSDATAHPNIFERGRAAIVNELMWEKGTTLKIRFVERRSDKLERRIMEVAEEWITLTGANLTMTRVDDEPSDIRISFAPTGSWSYLGTDAAKYPNTPTMNFGWLHDGSDDTELRRVVLHEFGHALGLIHEHQNPEVTIQWNKEAVYEELKGTWSRAKIDHNLFAAHDRRSVTTQGYDPKSIMHYPIPARWTHGGGVVLKNHDLSPGDIELIRTAYGR
jgi:hypothetical protein